MLKKFFRNYYKFQNYVDFFLLGIAFYTVVVDAYNHSYYTVLLALSIIFLCIRSLLERADSEGNKRVTDREWIKPMK